MTLAELQRQANFPLIAAGTVLIDQRLRKGNYHRVLLSSRDCYMQAHLWRQMFPSTPYEVCYWMTSRWARIHASEAYLEYCWSLMAGKVLIVDVSGSGESLRTLFHMIGVTPDYLILQSDPRKNPYRLLDGPGDLEGLNCAPHPMIIDVISHQPFYANPKVIDWQKYFEDIAGPAFLECCKASEFSAYIDASDEQLLITMRIAEKIIADSNHLFEPFHLMRRNEDWQ